MVFRRLQDANPTNCQWKQPDYMLTTNFFCKVNKSNNVREGNSSSRLFLLKCSHIRGLKTSQCWMRFADNLDRRRQSTEYFGNAEPWGRAKQSSISSQKDCGRCTDWRHAIINRLRVRLKMRTKHKPDWARWWPNYVLCRIIEERYSIDTLTRYLNK